MSKVHPNIRPQIVHRFSEEREREIIRQQKETFDQIKVQDDRWFGLKLALGYYSIVMSVAILIVGCYILINNKDFSSATVKCAAGFIFVDLAGNIFFVWKIVLHPKSVAKLEPVTKNFHINKIKPKTDA